MYLVNSVLLGALSVLATSAIAQPVIDPHTSGWCGLHVTQFQENVLSDEWANSTEYVLEICVYDGAQVLLNSGPHNTGCPLMWESKGASQSVTAHLPFPLHVTIGRVDDDPILFSYNGQEWGSNDQEHHSSFGAYDGGKREGDTGFSC